MSKHVLDMYNYHYWANKKIFDRLKELPNDVYFKEINSIFPTISNVITHIYLTDYVWLDVISGKSMKEAMGFANSIGEQTKSIGIEEMETSYLNLSKRYIDILIMEDNEEPIVVDNPYAGGLETSISETILHIVTHGSYHRGNIAAMLRQQGYQSVMQDYGLYLYDKEK
ncbi:DinB family protein [Bacillus sp. RG28]|uniref:DinB family protein n=1 Tax=Gottfriedia endophytica TaxID=2820819 RepID=A0A940NRN3_9BACI|nr:DinB family protein [Gottfriedia endophytica]MBP0726540.1 DinB family protein [Gottfriedia endophytica]